MFRYRVMAKLTVLSEGYTGLSFEVRSEKSSIGRLGDNAISIPEASVSSRHCEVWLKGDDIAVVDQGSTNGSFINDLKLIAEKEATLRPGQTLRLGQIQLRFELETKHNDSGRPTVQPGMSHGGGNSPTTAFAKKTNKANKIIFGVGTTLLVIIIGALVYAFGNLSSGPTP